MKKTLLVTILFMFATTLIAQSNNNEDEVVKIDQWNRYSFRENEVIVKFKPTSNIQISSNAQTKLVTASVKSVNNVLADFGIEEAEPLMPNTGKRISPLKLKAFNGSTLKDSDMSKLYRLRISKDAKKDVHEVCSQLQALDDVEYAEPNYIVYTLAVADSTTYTAEPLYSQQWGISAIGLPQLWNKPKVSDERPVIAIIDTGVDVEHPDLKDNIWVNEAEKNGVAGKDDDGNGIVDDIYGYDFVNKTGNMADFNGHGTHCAGIAAAVGNNGIGITGANPDALIMPITVMQSDGTGDVATIIKGIDYAAANGADVISMSLGGYNYSIAEEQALGKAYATAVIVAAAGNDFFCINNHYCYVNKLDYQNGPVFPAALQFVLGVEASNDAEGNLAGFSNFDCDGPLFSTYQSETQLYNYELRAPGVKIMSTFPNGRYKNMNGTSMACPMAAGAISRLLQTKEYDSKELLFGDLIHTRKKNMDILSAYNIDDADRRPVLSLVTYHLTDTLGDNDGRPDAGDTIAIYPVLRNEWGQAENIKLWMEVGSYTADGEFVPDDTTLVTLLSDTVAFGMPLSSYAKNKSANPIRFVVDKNVVDGRRISMVLKATCDNIQEPLEQEVILTAENGVEIGGMITEDLTLYPNVHYIVTKDLLVPKDMTLTIKPGTVVNFKGETDIRCEGNFYAKGTIDSMIILTGERGNVIYMRDTISYVNLNRVGISNTNIPSNGRTLVAYNCYARGVIVGGERNVMVEGNIEYGGGWGKYNNIINNRSITRGFNSTKSNILNNHHNGYQYTINYVFNSYTIATETVDCYLGSSRDDILQNCILDFNHPLNPTGYGIVLLDSLLREPVREAHGIVWKVVVNGYDAQDEFEQLPPLGVGKHKFEVYFNRPMDVSIAPTISMGVRSPYTQNSIAEDGSWSADSTIYTAYLTITGKTNTDGLNRIYVYGAEDDEHFEIPYENTRFNVQVSAAGSLSTGLMAEAGLGKVALTWQTDEEDFEDLLGYNIYRWTEDTIKWDRYYDSSCKCYVEAGWRIDTICINQSVIDAQDNSFVDYDVIPGKTYYYYIKQITTALTSYALSNAVAATPLTAQKGDANGSMSVDVADVVAEVTYLTGGDPEPFIFEAADVNSDSTVNILDIVGTINIITKPSSNTLGVASETMASYSIEDGILYVETPVVLGGVQFTFATDKENTIEVLDALNGFENVSNWTSETSYLFMAYSMSGKTLSVGKHALLRIGDATIDYIVLSDNSGKNIPAVCKNINGLSVIESMQMRPAQPNPFKNEVRIPYLVGQSGTHDVRFVFTDLAGVVIDSYDTDQSFGEYEYVWRPSQSLSAGVYFVTLYVDNKKMQVEKLILIH